MPETLKRPYPRRFIPRAQTVPWKLQEGDIELLNWLYNYRLLEAGQLAALVGRGKRRVQERLRLMFDAKPRLVTKPPRQHDYRREFPPDVYALANGGADVLAERGIIERGKRDWTRVNQELKHRTIEHGMMVSNFMVCLTLALRSSPDLELVDWIPEGDPLVYRFVAEGEKHFIDPDGFISLKSSKDNLYHHFALEADRSTESHPKFSPKLAAYWLGQGEYKEHLGINRFRVLTICRSPQRRDNLAQLPSQVDARGTGSPMFLFASETDFDLEQPKAVLGEVWRCGVKECQMWHGLVQ